MNIKLEKEFLHAIYSLLYGDYTDDMDEVIQELWKKILFYEILWNLPTKYLPTKLLS